MENKKPDMRTDERVDQCHCEASMIMSERLWRSREIPKDCKKADVTPVFKKAKEDTRNGR